MFRVGQIGIGNLGSRVATKLVWSGYPLHVYDVADISVRIFNAEYGGMMAGSPNMVAQVSDVVVAVLPTAKELRDICFGWEGLVKGFRKGGILLDLGTTDPVETLKLARELAERGIYLVDAPAVGTRDDAKQGKLTFFAGGEDEAFNRCKPVLEALGDRVMHVGPAGAGQAMTALGEFLRASSLLAATEALEVGRRFGLKTDTLIEVGHTLGALSDAARESLRGNVLARKFESGVALGHMMKNIDLARALARATKTQAPLLAASADIWSTAQDHIGSGADYTEMLRWIENLGPAETPKA